MVLEALLRHGSDDAMIMVKPNLRGDGSRRHV